MQTAKSKDFGFRASSSKEVAEAYVRSKIPELMELSFGCEIGYTSEIRGYREFVLRRDTLKSYPYYVTTTGGFSADSNGKPDSPYVEIIGHPIALHHWLRVLDAHVSALLIRGDGSCYDIEGPILDFNLTTGQPATEADYQSFLTIVGEDKKSV